jgi:chemotaxis protein CheC
MLTDFHLDALKELVNTGMGKAASALNELLDSFIVLQVPAISLVNPKTLQEGLGELSDTRLSCVQLGFSGAFSGVAALVFPPQSAIALVSALTCEDPGTPHLNAVMAGTLNEVGNIVINGVIGTLGNILTRPFDFSLPNYLEGRLSDLLKGTCNIDQSVVLLIRTHFKVQDLEIEGNIFLIFELKSFDCLLSAIENLCQTA